jgi:hypothetical protein
MTISKDDLSANEALALELLGRHCVSAAIGEAYQKNLADFQPILATTWKALADAMYIRFISMWHFVLTPTGWIKALEATGTLCDAKMKANLGLICSSLKGHLKRTQGPGSIQLHVLEAETGLPHHWVVNVIYSHLIAHCLQRKDAHWAEGDDMESWIEIPIDFGHPL